MRLNFGLNMFGMCGTPKTVSTFVETLVETSSTCPALKEPFKHAFKHWLKHIRDVRHSRNVLNMRVNTGFNMFRIRGTQASHIFGMCGTQESV